jgi:hypothetical protein
MFIASKDTKLIAIHKTEWQCRRNAKGLSKHDSNSYQILKNGSVVSQSRTTYTTNTHGVAFCHVNLSLVRGDRIQTAGQRYLGGNWGHLIIERV